MVFVFLSLQGSFAMGHTAVHAEANLPPALWALILWGCPYSSPSTGAEQEPRCQSPGV